LPPRLVPVCTALIAALILTACGSSASSSHSSTASSSASGTSTLSTSTADSGQLGYEGVPLEIGPLLGPARTPQTSTVDRISCAPTEQLYYHIHMHLAVFDNGRLYSLPPGIGIPGSVPQNSAQGPIAAGGQCIYWLHTHTSDGIIHIESPVKRIFDLGNFFDLWHQPLSSDRVANLHGKITAFVNGQLWTRSVSRIPLLPHALIQLNIGEPAPPLISINWNQTSL
jgi:hypothetical protein